MDWSYFLEILLKVLGSVAATVITGLAGWLFTKLSSKIKDSRINAFIKEAVKAAEQLYPNQGVKMGTEKYAYVVRQTLAKFPSLSDNDYLRALIEGAVFALNKQLEEAEKKELKKIESGKDIIDSTVNTATELVKKETSNKDKPKLSSF